MNRHNKHYEQNRDKILARHKRWRDDNPEKARKYQEDWRRANEGYTYETPEGYVKYIGYEHPATAPNGLTQNGRIVLWDKLSGQDAPCHWCGSELSWEIKHPRRGALLADHVNHIKNDDRPENLVPSCHKCNVSREDGADRKPSKNAGRVCEAIEGCDRPGVSHSKNKKSVWVCLPHFMQDSAGKEFTPLRKYVKRGGTLGDTKECVQCDQWLPLDKFYWRNGKPKGPCKKCEIKRAQERRARVAAENIPCKAVDCTDPAVSRGLCSMHYQRVWASKKKVDPRAESILLDAVGHDYEVEL